MSSSKENVNEDESDNNSDKFNKDVDYDPKWDEWYDDNEYQNKKTKLRRSKKRFYKQRDEW